MKSAALRLIWIYQRALSPYVPASCRFVPSCSHYAHEAVVKFGILRGSWLTLKRLARCRPMACSDYDPVPES